MVLAMTVRFLHIADIHLGYDHYNNPERTKDFFFSLEDVIRRYALEPAVDFVLIAGDLFEHRDIKPSTLNQAEIVLKRLKEQGIPVLAIEGNHDNRPFGVKTSWLKYLEGKGWLYLLEPEADNDGNIILHPWHEHKGAYCDLPCGVRVIGTTWYASQAARVLPRLATAITALPKDVDTQILLLHHGLEGQIARYEGALRYSEVLPLHHAGIDYLALGHIHKNYSLEGWIFNPGSLEANNMGEYDIPRGAYFVTVEGGEIKAELVQDYRQRPHVGLEIAVKADETPQQVRDWILNRVEAAQIDPQERVMLDVKVTGELGFPAHELDQRRLQAQLDQMTGALVTRITVNACQRLLSGDPTLNRSMPRRELERRVFEDLIASHASYRSQSQELAELCLTLKEMQQSGSPVEAMYELAEAQLLAAHPKNP